VVKHLTQRGGLTAIVTVPETVREELNFYK
jgi:hypothetical protein